MGLDQCSCLSVTSLLLKPLGESTYTTKTYQILLLFPLSPPIYSFHSDLRTSQTQFGAGPSSHWYGVQSGKMLRSHTFAVVQSERKQEWFRNDKQKSQRCVRQNKVFIAVCLSRVHHKGILFWKESSYLNGWEWEDAVAYQMKERNRARCVW